MTPENIGNFLGKHQFDADKMIFTNMVDSLILDTFGGFINSCPDQELCAKIKEVLIPIQVGEKEATDIPLVTRAAMDEYCQTEEEAVMQAEIRMM